MVEQQLPRLHSRYVRFFVEYDPRVDLKQLAIPVLAISGSLDQAVPANENLNEFEKIGRWFDLLALQNIDWQGFSL